MLQSKVSISIIGGLLHIGSILGIEEVKKSPPKAPLEKQLCTAIKYGNNEEIPSLLLHGANVKPKKN